MEDTVLKAGLHIFLCHVLADVEGSLHGAGIAFLADHAALLILFVLVKAFVCGHGQITVLQVQFNLILLESRQIHINFIPVFQLADIGPHFVLGTVTIELTVHLPHLAVHVIKCITQKVIKKIFIKNTRHQHNPYFLSNVETLKRDASCSCIMFCRATGRRSFSFGSLFLCSVVIILGLLAKSRGEC